MNFNFPRPDQIPQLCSLWKTAFGDTDTFIDAFFQTAFAPERCLCLWEDGQVLSMLYWFDATWNSRRLAYLYGVATAPEFRGHGFCRALMAHTVAMLQAQNYQGLLLYPASEELAEMYQKMGFSPCTTVTEFDCDAGKPIFCRPITPQVYARRRRELLPPDSVIQEGATLTFLATQANFYEGTDWIAAISSEEDHLICPELLGNPDAAPGILGALGKKRGHFRCPGSEKPLAMAHFFTEYPKKPAYFGLPLD